MQTLAVTIRTLATNDLTKNNFNQNILKEFNIGILNGIIFAIISSLIVQFGSRLSTFVNNFYINGTDNGCCRIIRNSCTCNIKENEY